MLRYIYLYEKKTILRNGCHRFQSQVKIMDLMSAKKSQCTRIRNVMRKKNKKKTHKDRDP